MNYKLLNYSHIIMSMSTNIDTNLTIKSKFISNFAY